MKKFYKINQFIKSDKVRVISDNENLGEMTLAEALFKARQKGMDLVQVSDKVEPPICKIVDFRKFQYGEQKKEQAGKKKGNKQEVKEIWFTPFIGQGDFQSRIKKIKAFLSDGDKVKLTVKFVGRQITRKDFGDRVLHQAMEELEDLYKIETNPVLQGKLMSMTIRPSGKKIEVEEE